MLGKAEQSWIMLGRLGNAGQGWSRLVKAGQGWARLGKAGQGWTRLSKESLSTAKVSLSKIWLGQYGRQGQGLSGLDHGLMTSFRSQIILSVCNLPITKRGYKFGFHQDEKKYEGMYWCHDYQYNDTRRTDLQVSAL